MPVEESDVALDILHMASDWYRSLYLRADLSQLQTGLVWDYFSFSRGDSPSPCYPSGCSRNAARRVFSRHPSAPFLLFRSGLLPGFNYRYTAAQYEHMLSALPDFSVRVSGIAELEWSHCRSPLFHTNDGHLWHLANYRLVWAVIDGCWLTSFQTPPARRNSFRSNLPYFPIVRK